MYATKRPSGRTVYRCGSIARLGAGACGNYEIREELILPFVLKLLGDEMEALRTLGPQPPAMPPAAAEKLAELEREEAALKAKISRARRQPFGNRRPAHQAGARQTGYRPGATSWKRCSRRWNARTPTRKKTNCLDARSCWIGGRALSARR